MRNIRNNFNSAKSSNDNSENVSLGVEYSWSRMLFIRGGYKLMWKNKIIHSVRINVPISMRNSL